MLALRIDQGEGAAAAAARMLEASTKGQVIIDGIRRPRTIADSRIVTAEKGTKFNNRLICGIRQFKISSVQFFNILH